MFAETQRCFRRISKSAPCRRHPTVRQHVYKSSGSIGDQINDESGSRLNSWKRTRVCRNTKCSQIIVIWPYAFSASPLPSSLWYEVIMCKSSFGIFINIADTCIYIFLFVVKQCNCLTTLITLWLTSHKHFCIWVLEYCYCSTALVY